MNSSLDINTGLALPKSAQIRQSVRINYYAADPHVRLTYTVCDNWRIRLCTPLHPCMHLHAPAGEEPVQPALLRKISSLVSGLPAMDHAQFHKEYTQVRQ